VALPTFCLRRQRLARLPVTVSRVDAVVTAVAAHARHEFSKPSRDRIRLLEGLGVEGDAHAGATVKHRSRVRRDPTQPNLRQVHLIHAELHDELCARGFEVAAGDLGENVTTRGVDLLGLPAGARSSCPRRRTARSSGSSRATVLPCTPPGGGKQDGGTQRRPPRGGGGRLRGGAAGPRA
jgi:hypothetical protein